MIQVKFSSKGLECNQHISVGTFAPNGNAIVRAVCEKNVIKRRERLKTQFVLCYQECCQTVIRLLPIMLLSIAALALICQVNLLSS